MSRRTSPAPQNAEELSLFQRARRLLRELSPILAAAGAIATVGGSALFLWSKDLQPFAQAVVLVGLALLVLAGLASLGTVIATVTGRRGRYSANTLAMVALLFAFLAVANIILFQRELRYDSTATRQFTLSDHTVKVLEGLQQPVQATAFYVPTESTQAPLRRQAEDLLYEFKRRSPQFTYRFVDPERDPSTARQYGVTQFSSIVFEATGPGTNSTVYTPPVTEQDFTSALLIVTGEQRKKVFFLAGHGERSIQEVTEDTGLGLAAQGVAADNYQVEPLSLSEEGAERKLEEAAVLVIAGPENGFLTLPVNERALLEGYLAKGGNALFLVDTTVPRAWRQLLAHWGVAVLPGQPPDERDLAKIKDPLERALALVDQNPGFVVDKGSSVTSDPRTPILQRNQYERSEASVSAEFPRENPVTITRELDVTFYPGSVAVAPALKELPQTLRVTVLAHTTADSWLTPDQADNALDSTRDTLGPHVVALAAEAVAPIGGDANAVAPGGDANPTRIVVFGDTDFATNKYFYAYSNGDFFLNALNWLAQDYNLISIRPKPVVFRELVTNKQEFDFIRYSSLFLLPASILLFGAVVWWRRQ
ncbi:MAG: hypothetical protein EXR55_02045 [Dehalococcoidia bacterium]|nr:hypothetical protein [Dehalococcoidia bacterium]